MSDMDTQTGAVVEGDTRAVYAALCKARAMIPAISKRGKTGQGRPYATLDDILDTCMPVLAQCELAIPTVYCGGMGGLTIQTTLYHVPTGQTITTTMTVDADFAGMNTMQKLGSMGSYARRYQIAGLLQLELGDDDDAESLSKPRAQTGSSKTTSGHTSSNAEPSVAKARMRVFGILKAQGLDYQTHRAECLVKASVALGRKLDSLGGLTEREYRQIADGLEGNAPPPDLLTDPDEDPFAGE